MKLRRFGARRDAGQDVAPDSAAPEAQHTCPQCGALVSSRAKTCAYCGADLAAIAQAAAAQEKAIEREKRAEAAQRPTRIFVVLITAVLVLIILAVVIQGSRQAAIAALTPTITRTPTRAPLPTATPRASPTPTYTPTPLQPIEYVVKNGDTPGGIAALYDVSAEALMAFNGKQVDDVIVVGETLKIPIPTPTPTAMSTAVGTPATSSAPSEQVYTVKAGDTLSGIAVRFGVPLENIQHRNNIVDIQSLQVGQQLVIPLSAAPTSTAAAVASSDEATPTPPVQYPAVKLLTPLDREIFVGNSSPILLQWLSSGILRLNESYRVEIEQLGSSRPVQFSVTHATSFHLMPDQFPPPDDRNRTFRWGVSIVRKAGTDSEGGPIYAVVSPISQYSFEWLDVPPTPTATATPLPGSRPAVLPSATPSATPK